MEGVEGRGGEWRGEDEDEDEVTTNRSVLGT